MSQKSNQAGNAKLIGCLLLMVLCSTPAGAQDKYWSSATGGSWHAGSNWGGSAPGLNDDVFFHISSGSFPIQFSTDASVNKLTVQNNATTRLVLNGRFMDVTTSVNVGGVGSGGSLTVENGHVFSTGVNLTYGSDLILKSNGRLITTGGFVSGTGTAAGGRNLLSVSNTGTRFQSDYMIFTTGSSSTRVNVFDGGRIDTGQITITSGNTGSSSLLDISDDARVESTGNINVGTGGTGTGEVLVHSYGNLATTEDIILGSKGRLSLNYGTIRARSITQNSGALFTHSIGTMTIDGGALDLLGDSHTLNGGTAPTQTATLNLVNGATFNRNLDLTVGDTGRGSFGVYSGSTTHLGDDLLVGYSPNGNGSVIVSGAGSQLTVGDDAYFGRHTNTTASLYVEDGGYFKAPELWLAGNSTATANAYFNDAGSLTYSAEIDDAYVGGTPSGSGGTALFEVDGGKVKTTNVQNYLNGTVTIKGGFLETKNFNSAGTFNPLGGQLIIDGGNLTLAGSTNTIESDNTSTTGTVILQNGATYNVANSLIIGNTNRGEILYRSGAQSTITNDLVIGGSGAGRGNVYLQGAGTVVNVIDVTALGRRGTARGDLSLQTGAQFNTEHLWVAGETGTRGGLVIRDNGSKVTTDYLHVGGENNVAFSGGTGVIVIDSGGYLQTNILSKFWASGDAFIRHGTFEGNGVIENHGRIRLDAQPGSQAYLIADDINLQPGGKLEIYNGQVTANNLRANNGTLTTWNGSITIDGGQLVYGSLNESIGSELASGNFTVKLQNGAKIQADIGGTVQDLSNLTVGQFRRGHLFVESGSQLTGLTNLTVSEYSDSAGSSLTLSGSTSTIGATTIRVGDKAGSNGSLVTNGGTISASALELGNEAGSFGLMDISGSSTVVNIASDVSIGGNAFGAGGQGTLNVSNGGMITSFGKITNWANGTVNQTGGTITAGSRINNYGNYKLTGGATNAGTFDNKVGGALNLGPSGTLNVALLDNYGAVTGSGTINGNVSMNAGSSVSPGSSPGELALASMTWNGGAKYLWEIDGAVGIAGSQWDLLTLTGSLQINATQASPFEIDLLTLDGTGSSGLLSGFDPSQNYSWTILQANGGITGFNVDSFSLDTTGFHNSHGGNFSLFSSGSSLGINYVSAVPEPNALLMLAMSITGLGFHRRKRV